MAPFEFIQSTEKFFVSLKDGFHVKVFQIRELNPVYITNWQLACLWYEWKLMFIEILIWLFFYQRGLSIVDLYQQWNFQHSLHSEFMNNLKTSSKMLLQWEKGFWVVHSVSSEWIVYESGFPDLNEDKLYIMT